ncbi:MAG TPA: DMT family transporter [Candidatus Angelobacter sp.]|jgi:drug/metabolite transporter (DMT)-like permease|nr:DMT family transporter [Candidatus Angelobacter sp.]
MSDQALAINGALPAERRRLLPLIAAIAASACWGFGTVTSKEALEFVPPLTLFAVQLVASVIFLSIAIIFQPQRFRWSLRGILGGATGLLEPGIAYMLGMIGLNFTSASNASVITSSEPIIIVLLAWLLLKEPIRFRTVLSAAVAISGVLIVTSAGARDIRFGGTEHTGDFLILAGTLSASAYVVLSHRLVQKIEPLHLLVIQQGYGLVLVLVVWGLSRLNDFEALSGKFLSLDRISAAGWIWAATSGIVQYALAFWFYLLALKKLRANVAAVSLALIPVFGVGGAWVCLGEPLTGVKIAGVCTIVVAMVGASWNSGSDG